MAFVHGKNTSLYIRDVQNKWRVISMFVQEVDLPTKIDTPETTTFGKGAKTVVPGIRDATFQVKGYFDSSGITAGATTGPAGPGIKDYAGIDVLLGGLMGYQPTDGIFGPYLQVSTGVFTQAAADSTAPAAYTLNPDGTLQFYGGASTTSTSYSAVGTSWLTSGQTLGQVIVGPQGDGGYLGNNSVIPTTAQNNNVKYMFDGVLTDYQISSPVKNVVSISATFQVNGPFLRDSTGTANGYGTAAAIAWPSIGSKI